MNEKKRWNALAPSYNNEIFDVFANDKNAVLTRYFKKYGNKRHQAIDFGCGNGKAFRYIAPRFQHVTGYDISQVLLDQAASLGYKNVTLGQRDLAQPNVRLSKADFLFCCNVAILSNIDMNNHLIRNAQRSLKPKGAAVFVVPSMESMLYSSWRLIDWYKKERVEAADIDRDELNGFMKPQPKQVLQGLIDINGVLTKHYSEPELHVVFERAGFQIKNIEKIEYDWTSEFATPPRWMQAPFPWDWLVEARAK